VLAAPAPDCGREAVAEVLGASAAESPGRADPYQRWLAHNAWNETALRAAEHQLTALPRLPLLSVLLPVRQAGASWLKKTTESVWRQAYPYWELCLTVAGPVTEAIRSFLGELAAADPRSRLEHSTDWGTLSRASNQAARLAQGEFLVLLDEGVELAPNFLLELARAILADPATDLVYSDEDAIDRARCRRDPQFKPDWSPEFLLARMYLGGAWGVRRSLFERLGGFRERYEGCLGYDLALRASEKARKVTHVPRVLHHRRGPVAGEDGTHPDAVQQGICAAEEALARRGVRGRVSRPPSAALRGAKVHQIDFPESGPRVTIIIPTRDCLELLRPCVLSVLEKTAYQDYDILIIDNESAGTETLRFLNSLPNRCRVLRLSCPGGRFNYAWLNNEAVRTARGDYVLFLNNDTEVRNPEWLGQMVGYAQFEGVGAVGARLLFGDGRVQHAGVVTELYSGMAGHAFRLMPGGEGGYLDYAFVARNYSAVTAACLLIRRDLFLDVGGFDQERFAVAYNDVDLCLRLRERGYRCVYAPRAELYHFEGASRGHDDNPLEVFAYRATWGKDRDPYFNPNLSPDNELFGINSRLVHLEEPPGSPPLEVLFFTPDLTYGRESLWQHRLAVALKERGRILPRVCAAADGPLARAYRERAIPVVVSEELAAGLDTPAASWPQALARFVGRLEREGCQVVHANTLAAFWVVHAAALCHRPSVWSVHEGSGWCEHFARFGEPLTGPAARAFALPYRVLFSADGVRAHYQPLNTHDNFSVLRGAADRGAIRRFLQDHSPADVRARLGCPPARTVLTALGTTGPRGGQQDLVRAALTLLGRGREDIFCYLLGCRPGPYLDQLRQLIGAHRPFFELVPETNNVFPYYRASDILVSCLDAEEGFPDAVLEGLAFGVPVVTTPALGVREYIHPGFSALTYHPGDVAGLTGHLERLLQEPDTRLRLGRQGLLTANHLLSFEELAARYERILREAYHASRPPLMPLGVD
jgi:GT2 family glycosyltransferase